MDPSNNNAFDSFGNNAGAGNGASIGGVGAGIGSGETITSPNAGATNSGSIVSSGATAVNNEYTSNSFPEGGLTIGGDKKRSRKGLIIAGIVFFVLAIGGGLAALAAMNGMFGGGSNGNSGNNNGSSIVIDDSVSMEVAFNRYANYLVSGEVKDEVVEDVDIKTDITLDEKYNDKEYVNYLNGLFKVFRSKLMELDAEYKPMGDLSRIANGLDYLVESDNIEFIDEGRLKEIYLTDGSDAAIALIDEYDAAFSDEDSNMITSLKRDHSEYERKMVELWELYKEKGCISEGQFVDSCIETITEDNYIDMVLELDSLNAMIDSYALGVISNIKLSSVTCNDYLRNVKNGA